MGEAAGTECSEAHQSHLISAPVMEPDVPTLPPGQLPAAQALEKSWALSTFLLLPKLKESSLAPVTHGGPQASSLGRSSEPLIGCLSDSRLPLGPIFVKGELRDRVPDKANAHNF